MSFTLAVFYTLVSRLVHVRVVRLLTRGVAASDTVRIDLCAILTSIDVFIDLRCSGSVRSCSPPSPGGVFQGAGGDRQKDRERTISRLRRSGLTSLLRVCFEGSYSVSVTSDRSSYASGAHD